MEGLATEDDPTAEKEENAENLRRMRPPNRKKFEEEVDSLMRTIRELEAKNKSLSHRPDDNLQGELKAIKAEIRATIERRKKIDSDLRNLNQHIEKQQAALSKIQSTLQYRSESKIDEAIRRLDYQLKTRNFKLSEEKKIVSEIDCLRRSRKNIGEYLTIKKEINDNRDRQRRMREERDHYYKAVKPLKNKEDELRKVSESHRSQIIENKKELDDLYEQKRHITAEFRKQECEYFEQRDDSRRKQREDQARKREEERRAHLEAKQRARAEIEANRIPHEEEIIACDLLISYLKRYCQQPEQPNSSTDNQDTQTKTTHLTDLTDDSEGTYILKRRIR